MTAKNATKIEAAYKKFADKIERLYGIKTEFNGIRRDGLTLSMNLVIGFAANGETIETIEVQQQRALMHRAGLKPEAVGQTFVTHDGIVKVRGFNTRAPMAPMQFDRNGKPYKAAIYYFHQICSTDPNFKKFVLPDYVPTPVVRNRRRFKNFADFL